MSYETIVVCVPQCFKNPLESGWSPEENALAMELGAHALLTTKRTLAQSKLDGGEAVRRAQAGWRDTLEKVLSERDACNAREMAGKLRESEATCAQLRIEVAELRVREDVREKVTATTLESERETFTARVRGEEMSRAESKANGFLKRAEERSERAEDDLRTERKAQRDLATYHENETLRREAKHKSDREELMSLLHETQCATRALEEELSVKNEALRKMSVASNKGNAVEREIVEGLSAAGFHAINTSKGIHNTHYHDILVARTPLHEMALANGCPTYMVDTIGKQLRCSIESKAHSSSNALTQQREKFCAIRRAQVEAQRAECFVFVAKARIPGALRCEFEFATIGDHTVVTGYIGAPDVTMADICVVVQAVMQMQERLSELTRIGCRPDSDALRDILEHVNESLCNLRSQIVRCDTMEKASSTMRDELKHLRTSLVASIMSNLDTLTSAGFPCADESLSDIRRARESLSSSARYSTCQILRTREQFAGAQASLAKRPRIAI